MRFVDRYAYVFCVAFKHPIQWTFALNISEVVERVFFFFSLLRGSLFTSEGVDWQMEWTTRPM